MQGGINEKNILIATRKKGQIFFVGHDTFRVSRKGVVRSRWSDDVIIVTKVIAMTKGNEKRRSEGYVSGFLLFPKATSETAATA